MSPAGRGTRYIIALVAVAVIAAVLFLAGWR